MSRFLYGFGPGAFRLLLAALVLVEHLNVGLYLGGFAVYAFFILSGFWIHVMWFGRYRSTPFPWLTFLLSRLWRVYPTYWAALAFVIFFRHSNSQPTSIPADWWILYASDYMPYLGPAWSLAIEVRFYILAPFLLGLFSGKRAYFFIVLTSILLVFLLQGGGTLRIAGFGAFFVIGVAAAELHWKPSNTLLCVSALSCLTMVIVTLLSDETVGIFLTPHHAYGTTASVLLAILACPCIIGSVRIASSGKDKLLGDFSYPLYLGHWLVANNTGGVTVRILTWAYGFKFISPFIGKFWLLPLITLFASILMSIVLFCIDLPLNVARGFWVRRRRKAASTFAPVSAVNRINSRP